MFSGCLNFNQETSSSIQDLENISINYVLYIHEEAVVDYSVASARGPFFMYDYWDTVQ